MGNPTSVDQLCSVITSHKEYITVATKGDIHAGEAPPSDNVLATDEQTVTTTCTIPCNISSVIDLMLCIQWLVGCFINYML